MLETYACCPICGNRLNKKNLDKQQVNDLIGDIFAYHYCKHGINHFYSSLSQDNQIQNMVVTLNHSTTVRLNFQKGTSIIFIQENFSNTQLLEIPKLLPIDFPKLEKLKEIIHLYMTFI